jgi:putative nucleotidyltransferase-like protein
VTTHPSQQLPFLPTPDQELLLKACLLEGHDAVIAWQNWRTGTRLNQIDIGSQRLLPFLADRLRRLGVRDSIVEEYRSVQRRTWAHNQLIFRAAGLLLMRLRTARIPAMALKGIVLASTIYETMSLRPMADFDLLVGREDGMRALDLLESLDWRMLPGQFRPRASLELAIRPACAFKASDNPEVEVDLHWRLLWARYCEDAEKAIWEQAVRFEIGGAECLAPCPADMLVHVCAHGTRWNEVPVVRWVVDAALLVRSGAVDWTHVLAQTQRLGLSLPLYETLKYLRTTMRVPIPDTVIDNLARSRVKSIERLLYEAEFHQSHQWSMISTLIIHEHIARHEVVRSNGPIGYLRYFLAACRGRSLRELGFWARQRLGL